MKEHERLIGGVEHCLARSLGQRKAEEVESLIPRPIAAIDPMVPHHSQKAVENGA